MVEEAVVEVGAAVVELLVAAVVAAGSRRKNGYWVPYWLLLLAARSRPCVVCARVGLCGRMPSCAVALDVIHAPKEA